MRKPEGPGQPVKKLLFFFYFFNHKSFSCLRLSATKEKFTVEKQIFVPSQAKKTFFGLINAFTLIS